MSAESGIGAARNPVSSHLAEAFTKKMERYVGNYVIPPGHVIPLVFDTFGAWHPKTEEYLRVLISSVAGDDEALRNSLWCTLRYRVASAIARGEGEVLLRLNYLNRKTGVAVDCPWVFSASGVAGSTGLPVRGCGFGAWVGLSECSSFGC